MKDLSLFLDTATYSFSLALKNRNVTTYLSLGDPKKVLERTDLGIKLLLDDLKMSDIGAYYTLLGPGSNTGIRLGLTVPRTIYALDNNIHLYGINTLELFSFVDDEAIPALSDRGGNLYIYKDKKVSIVKKDAIDINQKYILDQKDEKAKSKLKDYILIDPVSLMVKYRDRFIDFSTKESDYLPIYALKI